VLQGRKLNEIFFLVVHFIGLISQIGLIAFLLFFLLGKAFL
jgi:hypothetical protein